MLFDLPDATTLYKALLARDTAYDGRAYVGVSSTGVFCRLTCPARKPKAENCTFFPTVAECIEAGFRPCKRCHPLAPGAAADPAIARLLKALEAEPHRRWYEGDITRMGLDPSTVRRAFKRQYGMTFLEMARQQRLREGFGTLAEGGKVIEAQIDAQFSSPSAFRAAFAKLLGRAPGTLSNDALLLADWIETPLGDMIAIGTDSHLYLLEFLERRALKSEVAALEADAKGAVGIGKSASTEQTRTELAAFFAGQSAAFTVPLATGGTGFQRDVWKALQTIPAGETRSYADIARQIESPTATRAVARANGANRLALIIPCHRVIGADGSLTGYGGGLWRKQQLLEIERSYLPAPNHA
ncbi:bifunctional transcriptional activator/DNA repair protein Ada [Alphaproteobacteria bacterium KMM 3653]|uniref:methylated-DNA--[protein]-cysteine S-methyltransferase n=1 Tax=Harenicola maris TaxID=2841044 RepID=A0AAP2G9Q3_9RHOB|nr:bifunctional transcriptional activator/DNA repair protein Ada [Harenicola maris]